MPNPNEQASNERVSLPQDLGKLAEDTVKELKAFEEILGPDKDRGLFMILLKVKEINIKDKIAQSLNDIHYNISSMSNYMNHNNQILDGIGSSINNMPSNSSGYNSGSSLGDTTMYVQAQIYELGQIKEAILQLVNKPTSS